MGGSIKTGNKWIVDLFAGPGGWDQGLADLGVRDVVGLEIDKAACLTRGAAAHATIRTDVARYPTAPFAGRTRGLIASPPCQAFSLAGGDGHGRAAADALVEHVVACRNGWVPPPAAICEADVRADLTLQPLRWAYDLEPEWIALEQVPQVHRLWVAIGAVLEEWGYKVDVARINTADYGAPQTRHRAILIASLSQRAAIPSPSHVDPRRGLGLFDESWVTMAEALDWKDMGDLTLVNGEFERATKRTSDEPAPTIHFGKFANSVRWVTERPSPTVVGSFQPHIMAAPGWRTEKGQSRQYEPGSVQISVEEAGVLQTFPRDYPWQGSNTKKYEQIGNAVPPLIASKFLEQFVR